MSDTVARIAMTLRLTDDEQEASREQIPNSHDMGWQRMVIARGILVVGLLLAGCSDDGQPVAVSASTIVSVAIPGDAKPRFIASAPIGTIVFSSSGASSVDVGVGNELPDLDLYTVNPDGTSLKQITDGGLYLEPRWSTDGEQLAFVWSGDGTTAQIWIANRDGGNMVMFRELAELTFGGLRWSPDGTSLTFFDDGAIHVLDIADGTDTELARGSWPTWSVVGGKQVIVYTIDEFIGAGSTTSLHVIDVDGTNDRGIELGSAEVPSELVDPFEASAEVGSSRIAFVVSANGGVGEWNEEIYVAELIDGDPVRTTTPILISRSATNDHWPPAWSSANAAGVTCLVWTNDVADGASNLVIAHLGSNGGEIFDLTKVGRGFDWLPDWHPDADCPTDPD